MQELETSGIFLINSVIDLIMVSTRGDSCYLNAYYQNGRGISLSIIHLSVTGSDYDISAVTETWLQPSSYDNELFPKEYTILAQTNPDVVESWLRSETTINCLG